MNIESSTDARPLVERLLRAAVQRRASDLPVEPVAGGDQQALAERGR